MSHTYKKFTVSLQIFSGSYILFVISILNHDDHVKWLPENAHKAESVKTYTRVTPRFEAYTTKVAHKTHKFSNFRFFPLEIFE